MLTAVVVLLLLTVVAVIALLVATRAPYPIVDTVEYNADLPRIELDDVVLHGRLCGAEGLPLVVVLHGGPGGDHRSLLGLEDLTDRFRVLFFDQRGAGLSQRVPDEALSIDGHLADLDQLVDRYANGGDVILIGHSWGAMLAVAYLGHRPERIARAVLIEPGFLDAKGYEDWEARRHRISRSLRVLLAGLLAGFRARNLASDDPSAERDFLVGSVVHAFANHPSNPYHCRGSEYSAPSWRFGGRASDVFWANPHATIARIENGLGHPAPILLMAGGCNSWTGRDLQQRHAKRFPDAQVVEVDRSGHDVIWDQQARALEAIRAFLSGR